MRKAIMKFVFAVSAAVTITAAYCQDVTPDSTEETPLVVNDGGVEVVREAEAAALGEKPRAPRNAFDEVKSWLKNKDWKYNKWDGKKKRLIVVVSESFDCEDPAATKDVMVQRDMATKRAVLQAKAEIIEFVKSDVDAEDIVEMFGGNAPNISEAAKQDVQKKAAAIKVPLTQKSMVTVTAAMPLFGATCIRQSESWNRGKYQIALAMAWSPALERAARAVLTGEDVKCSPKPIAKSVEDWLEAANPAFMSGPIQFLDADGSRWFLGVSACVADENLPALTLKQNKRIADLSARQMLVFSLWGDVKAYKKMQQELTTTLSDGKANTETAQWMESKISQTVENLPLRGITRLFNDEVDHPIIGGKVYVSIYGINSAQATTALKIEAINFATRAEVERVKTIERGRAAANKGLVENATNDPRDFQKGQDAQNKNLGVEVEGRKGKQILQKKEDPKNTPKKSKAGVFNGGADPDDDF